MSGSEPLTVNSVHVDQPYYVVEKLLPYTTYLLKVFLVNEEGRYNPEVSRKGKIELKVAILFAGSDLICLFQNYAT